MKLTLAERQILYNQYKILEHLEKDNSHGTIAEILKYGYTGRYDRIFDVHQEEIPIEICVETDYIFDMYRLINLTISKLTSEERESIDLDKIAFDGFDANNDPHYGYASFIINKMKKYQEHDKINLNSHSSSTIRKYRKMLEYYNAKRKQEGWKMDFDELKKLIELTKK